MTPTRTPFAGYERLAPGDPLSSDGYAFQFQNPQIADQLGRIGAVTHKHDAHAAMADPSTAPTVTVAATGGSIDADTTIYVAYTLTDSQGGETLPTSLVSVTTVPGYDTPGAPTVTVDYTAGTLLAATLLYGITVTDGAGGETALGDAVTVTVDPGHAHAEATLSGLTAVTDGSSGGSGAAGWRVWRSVDGGSTWNLMGTGARSVDTFTDMGAAGDCTVAPPYTGTTVGTGKLSVTVPAAGQPAGATFFSIYADTSGLLLAPSLLGTYPVSDYGAVKAYTALNPLNGQPPAVSSCYPGASKINPDTDIVNWYWKAPVATATALPTVGNNNGDARITTDTGMIWIWNATGAVWQQWNPGGATLPATQHSSSYTLAASDSGTVVEFTGASAATLTISAHSVVALPVGAVVEVFQYGAGQVTVAAGSGVTLRSHSSLVHTAAQYSTISLRQRALDEWVLSGDLA